MKIILFILLWINTLCLALSLEWIYYEQDYWRPEICQKGKHQSPIELPMTMQMTTRQLTSRPFSLDESNSNSEILTLDGYDQTPLWAKVTNIGWTVSLEMEPRLLISGKGLNGHYTFAHGLFHWGSRNHRGSEHTFNGTANPMELQLIHYQSRYSSCEHAYLYGNFDALAILSVMFNIEDEDNPKLDRLINGIENVTMKSDSNFLNNTFPLKDLLPDNIGGGFYRYEGSVTSPSCKEIAIWTILKEQVGISNDQLEKFRNLYMIDHRTSRKLQDNFRRAQPLNGRTILDESDFAADAANSLINYNLVMFVFISFLIN